MLFLESLVEGKKVHLTVSFDEYKNRQVCSFIIDEIDRKRNLNKEVFSYRIYVRRTDEKCSWLVHKDEVNRIKRNTVC